MKNRERRAERELQGHHKNRIRFNGARDAKKLSFYSKASELCFIIEWDFVMCAKRMKTGRRLSASAEDLKLFNGQNINKRISSESSVA
jgi:hypothetical protein